MTHSEIIDIVERWVRREHKCDLTAKEFVCTNAHEIPDVIGWSSWAGISCLVEVKVSVADFKRDRHKITFRAPHLKVGDYRWYAVPEDLVSEIQPLIHSGWGLLVISNKRKVREIKVAERQKEANKGYEISMLMSGFRRLGVKVLETKMGKQ